MGRRNEEEEMRKEKKSSGIIWSDVCHAAPSKQLTDVSLNSPIMTEIYSEMIEYEVGPEAAPLL